MAPISSRSENGRRENEELGSPPAEPTPFALAPEFDSEATTSGSFKIPKGVKDEAPDASKPRLAPSLIPGRRPYVPTLAPPLAKTEQKRPLSWQENKGLITATLLLPLPAHSGKMIERISRG